MGEHVAKVLEKSFTGNIENFMKTNAEVLEDIDEVGPIVAETIVKFWADETNINIVNNCFKLGISLELVKNKN